MNRKFLTILLGALILFASCSSGDELLPPAPAGLLKQGTNTLIYTYYAPLADKPVTLYYHIPEDGDMHTMPILFAMHGAERDGKYQIDSWKDKANELHFMVFAPEFSTTLYPANRDYQYAGVSLAEGSWAEKSRDKWTVSIIENMFDFIKQQTGNTASKYDIWGHSAGAQFTHRLMFHLPEARIRKAIASNAGSYLIPSIEGYGANYSYPHSLRLTPYTKENIKAYFARNMVVHTGTADISTTADDLPKSAAANAQGPHRHSRALYFFNFAKAAAEEMGVPFNWTLVEVPNVAHSSRGMMRGSNSSSNYTNVGAAYLLYGN